MAESVCGPLGGNGRRGVPDRILTSARRPPVGWDTQLPNGHRSEFARDLADGQGILGDTRILIVDDSTLYREYLVGVIAAHGVVNPTVAWDLPSLIAAIENTMPRVILLNRATRESAMLLRQALKLSPGVRVIVLGMSEDDESAIVACAEAGVAGYHMRTESLEDLLVLIRGLLPGIVVFAPGVGNSASPVISSRFTTTTGGQGTSSYSPRGPDPQDAGTRSVQPGYRSSG